MKTSSKSIGQLYKPLSVMKECNHCQMVCNKFSCNFFVLKLCQAGKKCKQDSFIWC
ncbi:hypothetical protein GLYMA_15G255700v4 [Glycine max]|uniref:Uncharacterized protein n=2 Tax=Glycine subgen. Soja TaxID=1462606 RepID=K7MDY3_SOYBN|nr:hypothetical protein GYH30_043452 [Glycine max]KHN27734.1 hypothetical protein glysoja_025539 [Glycine soja]KRH13672.1 hypothetical protein GLYMA_15G255700v4 [Glycine max]